MKTIYYNGQIVTMENEDVLQAVCIEDGIIQKVGTNEEVFALKDDECKVIDLENKAMLPGFIDPHSHLSAVAYNILMVNANPSPTGTCDDQEAVIEAFKKGLAEAQLEEGDWLMGMGYDNSVFPDGKNITCKDLDKVSTTVPISCIHASGHCAIVNTKALELLGYVGDFEVPEGGTVERFEDGTPNGLITENAFISAEVQKKMKAPSFPKVLAAISKACTLYSSYGITTCQDARVTASELPLLTAASQMNALSIDVVGIVAPQVADNALVKGQTVSEYANHLRMGGYKLFVDGSPQAKTAWLSKPYYVAPEGKDASYCGFPVLKDEDVIQACVTCLENKWQLNVHCNGDEACEQLIRCYEIAIEKTGIHDNYRPVMIHAQTVRDDQLDRMAKINMMPSYFLDHVYYWGDWHYESVLGPERANHISPIKETIKRNIPFTMHQDAPVVNPNALFAVHNAVNRQTKNGRVLGEDQKISVFEALKGVTINGAYQIFEENKKGTIAEGKVADLVILDQNPLTVDVTTIKDIQVLETLKDGQTVYSK